MLVLFRASVLVPFFRRKAWIISASVLTGIAAMMARTVSAIQS
jgi:hypothetical protein